MVSASTNATSNSTPSVGPALGVKIIFSMFSMTSPGGAVTGFDRNTVAPDFRSRPASARGAAFVAALVCSLILTLKSNRGSQPTRNILSLTLTPLYRRLGSAGRAEGRISTFGRHRSRRFSPETDRGLGAPMGI